MFCETSPVPYCMAQEFAMLYDTSYGTYRGAVFGLRGAVVGVRGAAVGVRGAAVGNIGIPTYVISRDAVVRQPNKRFRPFSPINQAHNHMNLVDGHRRKWG